MRRSNHRSPYILSGSALNVPERSGDPGVHSVYALGFIFYISSAGRSANFWSKLYLLSKIQEKTEEGMISHDLSLPSVDCFAHFGSLANAGAQLPSHVYAPPIDSIKWLHLFLRVEFQIKLGHGRCMQVLHDL